jgi:MFS family permease
MIFNIKVETTTNPNVIGKENNSLNWYTWLPLGLTGDEMDPSESDEEICDEPHSRKTRVIIIGIVLAIIGYLISSSFAKDTITNYAGFVMLLAGVGIAVVGVFATASAYLKTYLCQTPAGIKSKKAKLLFLSIWLIGIGILVAAVGSLLGNAYAEYTMMNTVGYQLLLAGTGVFSFGVAVTALIALRLRKKQSGVKVAKPRVLLSSILSIAIAVALVITGFMLADYYEKESIMHYVVFGTLLTGIAVLSLGIAKLVVTILRNRLYPNGKLRHRPRLIFGGIWAMSIGLMLLINGSLIASSYAKTTLMNYSGFGMLLAGASVFVYGLFETARISAMGYFSSKRSTANGDMERSKKKEKLSVRFKNFWRNLVKTSAIINLIGVMVAIGLLFFSLWQLDLIVSGPVWYESPSGQGWQWPGPGAYAKEYFQCFIWQTTIGQAYDTLFLLIFISFIVVFASAYFWPRGRAKK